MKPRFAERRQTSVFESTVHIGEYTPERVTDALVHTIKQVQYGQRIIRICGEREEREFSVWYDKEKGLSVRDTAVDITVFSLDRIHELPRYKYVDISPVRRLFETHYQRVFQQGILTDELQSKVHGRYITPARLMDLYPTAVSKCMSGCAGIFSLWMDVENLSDIYNQYKSYYGEISHLSIDETIKRRAAASRTVTGGKLVSLGYTPHMVYDGGRYIACLFTPSR